MTAGLLVIGLDACEAALVEQWAAEGDLPNLAGIMGRAATARMAGPMDTLPGGIWPEIVTGRSAGRLGLFFHPLQIHSGEAVGRPVLEDEQDRESYYWSIASHAGRRVAVIDQPQVVLAPEINGLQILEWGCHDRTYSVQATPPTLLEHVQRRHGSHPVRFCDDYAYRAGGHEQLLGHLLDGLDRKSALFEDLLAREHWDLFTCGISESHCVGHHFWAYHDPASPYHDAAAPSVLKTAIRTVYQRIDRLVGQLVGAAGDDARVIVFTSHGMGPYIGGYQLLPEILARLGMSSDAGRARRSVARAGFRALRRHTPMRVRALVKSAQKLGPVRAIQSRAGALTEPLTHAATRAAAIQNNRVGAIRLNLTGREPFGRVRPGAEAAAVIEEIREGLLALTHPDTGAAIVAGVVTAAEAFGPDHHPDVPDIMVAFRRDIGPLEACRSDRVGTIRVPIRNPANRRSGDHTDTSRIWIASPGRAGGAPLPDADVRDIAPTVLGLLEVPVPPSIEGRPLAVTARHSHRR